MRAIGVAVNRVPLFRALAIILAGWLAVMPAVANESAMNTRFGAVTVVRSTSDSPPDTLAVNGKPAFVAEWEYIGLYRTFALGENDVVLFGVNCGGTGCPNDNLGFLVLNAAQPPRTVTGDTFFSNDGTVEPRVEGGKIVVDLGYEDGKRKIAEFDLAELLVRAEPRAVVPMDADQCQWLYDNALPECIQAKSFDSACAEPRQYFSGVVERSLSALSNHPGFVAARFDAACTAACVSGAPGPLVSYKAEVCSIR